MSLRQMRYFVAVAEAGSFTAAAHQLHVSQPALGLQMKLLEDRLAVDLLVRHSRGVTLTEAGAMFLSHVKPALRALDGAERAVTRYRKSHVVKASFGVTPSAGKALVPDLLQECNERACGLCLALREGASQEFWKMTAEGKLDFSVCYDPEENDALQIVRLYTEDLFLIGPPDQVETARGPINIADLTAYQLVLGDKKHALRQAIERGAAERGVRLNVVLEMELITLKREILIRTGRCSISPLGLLAADIERGRLGARLIQPAISATLCLLIRAGSDPQAQDILVPILRSIVGRRLKEGLSGWRRLDS